MSDKPIDDFVSQVARASLNYIDRQIMEDRPALHPLMTTRFAKFYTSDGMPVGLIRLQSDEQVIIWKVAVDPHK